MTTYIRIIICVFYIEKKPKIIYYIKNHSDITQHEIQEILLMEEILVLFQNGPVSQLPEILQRYGSFDLLMKYSGWLERLGKTENG